MEKSIDQQNLPGVKEVCRDFAVLEDHSLAHNLQEQEIEHHLASNIQRTRLVQHDLVMAKQLQEQEDLRAQARVKKQHKDLERQDCEIAQEFQEKLVIEADRRRRQEAKDEDIARLLQEKELKEEKKRKKHFLDPPSAEDGGFHLAPVHSRHNTEDHRSDHDRPRRPRSREPHGRSKDEGKRSQPKAHTEAHEHGWDSSDHSRRHSDDSAEGDGRPRQPRSREPHGRSKDEGKRSQPKAHTEGHEHGWDGSDHSRRHSDDSAEGDGRRNRDRDRLSPRKEGPERPPPPKLNRELDVNHKLKELERFDDHVLEKDRCTHKARSPQRIPRDAKRHDLKEPSERGHKRGGHLEPKQTGHRARSPSPYRGRDTGYPEESGMRVRGTRDVAHNKPRAEVKELDDAAIARRLQEEELRASQEDERAAQVAQDEEIARLFMQQEKKAQRKLKPCEKASHEKRRPEEWSIEVSELGQLRSRDRHEHHRPRSDKPSRPPPPSSEVIAESDNSRNYEKQPSSTRPFSKSESSPKGSYYRQ